MPIVHSYEELLKLTYNEGVRTYNKKNDLYTYAVPNVLLQIDNAADEFPIGTTRKSYWRKALLEFGAYLRGYSTLKQFHDLGLTTWDKNGLEVGWTDSKHCKGKGDLGRIYGVQGRQWQGPEGSIDQLQKVINNLKAGIDDRGEIITFWNPGELHMGCLRPCMYSHTFSLVGGKLHIASTSRSMDVGLGGNFNVLQSWFFLYGMSRFTGNPMGSMSIFVNNAHIYENQMATAKIEAGREAFPKPKLIVEDMKDEDFEEYVLRTDEDFTQIMSLPDYQHHDALIYPYTVTKGVK